MFENIIEGQAASRGGWKGTFLVSFGLHTVIIGVMIVVPLIYFRGLPTSPTDDIYDVFAGPPQVPIPPEPPMPRGNPTPRVSHNGPVVITVPDLIATDPTIPIPPDAQEIDGWHNFPSSNARDGGGVGIPTGVLSGPVVPDSFKVPTNRPVAPPPPPTGRKAPILISSMEPSKLIHRVEPEYPQLAIKARLQGTVTLRVLIDETGTITNVEFVSGIGVFREAAVTAVSQWRYKPTILNGEPVPVSALVTVNFVLRRQ